MGMSIKESLEWLISRKEHYEMDDNCQELAKALEIAINTMRKYQHVQEIMHKEYASDQADVCLVQRLVEIREVLEDGNDRNN